MRLSRLSPALHRPAGWRCAVFALLVLAAGAIHAQSATDDTSGDPPDRVARLSYLAGDIGFLPAGADDWSDASVNRPLTRGDRLAVASGGRAELELDRAALRVDHDTDLGVLQLDDQLAQFELTRGTLNLSVRALADGESYEIDTPTVALVVTAPGTFRVDVDERGGGTEITALDGQAVVYGANDASRRIVGGHTYRFDDSSLAQVDESYAGSSDAFDVWCADRDQRYADVQSGRYVSDEVIGYEDLDSYGSWQDDDDYGQVWYPAYVATDWAPYRFGHWAYVAPWGWTWIDDAPWGFAPYHYGRWAQVRGRWGWIPGPRGLRPVYAPALVAFVGGNGWGVSVGAGGPIGWFPLGPGDFYNPWYRVSSGYYRRVNRHNLRWAGDRDGHHDDRDFDEHWRHYRDGHDSQQHYANRDVPHGITAVSRDAFARAQRVQDHRIGFDAARERQAPVLAHGADVQPVHAGFAHAGPPRRAGGDFDRPVVMHRPVRALPAAHPVAEALPTPPRFDRGPAGGRPERDVAMPSARFAHERAVEPRDASFVHRETGTLPTVPRFVRAPPPTAEAVRRDDTDARPGTLRLPPRIEPARRTEPMPERRDDRSPRFAAERAQPLPAAPRFEPRSMPAPEAHPTFHPAPRSYAPPAAVERHEAPAPRPAPAPRNEEHGQSSAHQGHDGHPGNGRVHHQQ